MQIDLQQIKVHLPLSNKPLFQIPKLVIPSKSHILFKGGSGKGKTTFLHLLAGLFLPQDGKVTIGNKCLNEISESERSHFRRQHIGLIFQKLNLIDHLTAVENVTLSLNGENQDARAKEALTAIGMKSHFNQTSSVLSLGEQQRIAVARILASNCDLILADEPTSSLDDRNADIVLENLLKISNGKTLIVVSHDHRVEKYFSQVVNFEDFTQ